MRYGDSDSFLITNNATSLELFNDAKDIPLPPSTEYDDAAPPPVTEVVIIDAQPDRAGVEDNVEVYEAADSSEDYSDDADYYA